MFFFPLIFAASALAVGDGKGAKPQMGWNTWNSFKYDIDQNLIKETAEKIVSSGLANVGYKYVVIDAGWQTFDRGSNGRQRANETKFGEGIKALADYVHDRGLSIGIYSDAGIYDCGFYPGSWGYEELDAATYASWGIDYLKYDNCGGFQANTYAVQERFIIMANALKATGRDIFYSVCEWGHQFPWYWADQFAGSYRMSGDIHSKFDIDKDGVCKTAYCLNTGYAGVSVMTMIRKMRELSKFQKRGSWADMDMLETGTGTMNELEEISHFSLWAALKSPLIIGADLRNMSDTSMHIMKNPEIIAINQDDLGKAVDYLPKLSVEGKIQVWAGPLSSGTAKHVILVLNEGSELVDVTIPMSEIPGFYRNTAEDYRVRDVWASCDVGRLEDKIHLKGIRSHETKVMVISG